MTKIPIFERNKESKKMGYYGVKPQKIEYNIFLFHLSQEFRFAKIERLLRMKRENTEKTNSKRIVFLLVSLELKLKLRKIEEK